VDPSLCCSSPIRSGARPAPGAPQGVAPAHRFGRSFGYRKPGGYGAPMRLDGFMMARYAEQAPGGLVLAGGGWVTWNVHEPIPSEGGEPVPAALISGCVVARLMMTPDESEGRHQLVLRLLDSDDTELSRHDLELEAQRDRELPRSWEQLNSLIIQLGWLPMPGFGLYRFQLETPAGELLGTCPFQVVKRY
jgi:Family of unknown function (DUF6941)